MKCETININFKGYKNIIADSFRNPIDRTKINYLAMQLDNIGHRDLELWHNMQKKYLNTTDYSDVLLFLEMQLDKDYYFFVNNEVVPAKKNDLEKLSDSGVFKLYTMLASLTKRISNNNNTIKIDGDFQKVMLRTLYHFSEMLHDNTSAYNLLNSVILKPKPPQQIAGAMNNSICEVMHDFFA